MLICQDVRVRGGSEPAELCLAAPSLLPSLGTPPVPAQPQELTLHLESSAAGAALAAHTVPAKSFSPPHAQLSISSTSVLQLSAEPDETLWVYHAPPDGSWRKEQFISSPARRKALLFLEMGGRDPGTGWVGGRGRPS